MQTARHPSQLVTPSGDLSETSIRSAIESALKRSSTGFLKVIGLWTPSEMPTQNMFGQQQAALRTWQRLRAATWPRLHRARR